MAVDKYWADGSTDELVSECVKHINNWGGYSGPATSLFTTVASAWRRNLISYYSPMITANDWTTSLGFSGDQGELVQMSVPVARTVIRQFTSIITKQRLNFECDAEVNDGAAIQLARIGKVLAKHEIQEYDLESRIFSAAEQTAVLGVGYITCTWQNDKGYLIGADLKNGSPIASGGNCYENPDATEVIYDWTKKFYDQDWVIFKMKRNRWNLIQQFPDYKDDILAAPSVYASRKYMTDLDFIPQYQDSSYIYVYEFYHKPSNAVIDGRMTFFLDGGKAFYDEVNFYKRIPGVQFCFEDFMGTGLGYPMISSLLPSQEMFDHCMSVQATNQSSFGVQSVLVPKGADISAQNIQGLNFITYKPQQIDGGGKPEPLQLTSTPPEVPAFGANLERLIASNGYLNDAIRGNPGPGLTAGTAIATLSANAQEFLTAASKSVVTGIEKLMQISVSNYQNFGEQKQLESIVGKSNAYILKSFKTDKDAIKRVRIRTSNPLLNSTSGRMQIAEMLLGAQMLKNSQQVFSVLEGAPEEALFSTELDETAAVNSEIDAVLAGETVMPLITDNHPMFIRALSAILYQAQIRRDSKLVDSVTAVIQERVKLEMQCPPELKMMLRTGQAAPQQPQGPQQLQGGIPPTGPQEPTAQSAPVATAPATV